MKFTLTVLNDFDQTTQWFIFTFFQWVMFGIIVVIDQAIDDVPPDVKIQIERNDFLSSKLIDHVADDEIIFEKPPTTPTPKLQEYPSFGSRIHFTPGQGYTSETASRSTSVSSRGKSASGIVDTGTSTSSPLTEQLLRDKGE